MLPTASALRRAQLTPPILLAVLAALVVTYVAPLVTLAAMAALTATVVLQRAATTVGSVLGLFAVVLLVIPPRYSVGPYAVSAAMLVGAVAGGLWAAGKVVPWSGIARGRHPVVIAVLALLGVIVLSYLGTYDRPLSAGELSAANRKAFILLAFAGAGLLTADGLRSAHHVRRLLGVTVAAGALVAAVGAVQFLTSYNPVSEIELPVLQAPSEAQEELDFVLQRDGLARVAGTARHPIEFGVVLAALLPVCLHFTIHAATRWRRLGAALTGLLIVVVIPMSLSRSALLAVAAALAVLLLTLRPRHRLRLLIGAAAVVVVAVLVSPEPVQVLWDRTANASEDSSITARTRDYAPAADLIRERPLSGRGYGTFVAENYMFLDNQYLKAAIETGLPGLLALVAVFATAVGCAIVAGRRAADERTRHLSATLAASLAGLAVTGASFDMFAFPMATGVFFLLLGCGAALYRLTKDKNERSVSPDRVLQHP